MLKINLMIFFYRSLAILFGFMYKKNFGLGISDLKVFLAVTCIRFSRKKSEYMKLKEAIKQKKGG